MTRRVKQIVFPQRRIAELTEVEAPPGQPGADMVEGMTLASVLSAGTELGMQYDATEGFPHSPGYGSVFRVTGTGPEVCDLAPGDLAFCLGTHKSHQRYPRSQVVPVADGLDPTRAVLTRMIVIGWTVLVLSHAHPPARVMVTGLGAVGHFAARLAHRFGYNVMAVDPDPARRNLLSRYADVATFAEAPLAEPEWHEAVNLALECSGQISAIYDACTMAIRGGEVFIVGVPWAEQSGPTARQIFFKTFWRNVSLRSGYEWELPWAPDASTLVHPSPGIFRGIGYRDTCAAILDLLARGAFDVDGLYRCVSPQECAQVYREMVEGRTDILCTVFDWR